MSLVTHRGFIDGRSLNRKSRTEAVGLKISPSKRHQFDRLRLLTRWSYTDIFEQALDDFEAAHLLAIAGGPQPAEVAMDREYGPRMAT